MDPEAVLTLFSYFSDENVSEVEDLAKIEAGQPFNFPGTVFWHLSPRWKWTNGMSKQFVMRIKVKDLIALWTGMYRDVLFEDFFGRWSF